MKVMETEKIRQAVRDLYAGVAGGGATGPFVNPPVSCSRESEQEANQGRPDSCCSGPEITPEQLSGFMGYSKEEMDHVPEGANLGLGCGNPLALASIKPGETVVDLGSGGGFDCFLAARQTGENGRVIGVDMTPEMITKARKNAEKAGGGNVEFRLGEIEHLPVADNSADIIISNCVINLSPDKPGVFRDAFRVLKPGGRLHVSDILATAPVPEEIRRDLAAVSACIGGAATVEDTEALLKEAGFEGIRITPKNESQELIREWMPGSNVGDYVVSAYIEAVKPG